MDEYKPSPASETDARILSGDRRKRSGSPAAVIVTPSGRQARTRPSLDLEGRIFGDLTVLHKTDLREGDGAVVWACRCACGVVIYFGARLLASAQYASCGCSSGHRHTTAWRQDPANFYPKGTRRETLASTLAHIRAGAQKRGLRFDLTLEQFGEFAVKPCEYCGAAPDPRNGVDRINSTLGYTLDNLVSSCHDCNIAKHGQTKEAFLEWCKQVIAYQERAGGA